MTRPKCVCLTRTITIVESYSHVSSTPNQAQALKHLYRATLFEEICRPHLRRFAGHTLNMFNNVTTELLTGRLRWVYARKRKLDDVRRARPSWFRGQAGKGGVWREPLPLFARRRDPLAFTFDAKRVFDRFAGEGMWERWQQDGTVIIPGVFEHLRSVQKEIHSEFDMYAFHLRAQPGLPEMGWMRNMYHSGPQQLMYQDPVFYALTAAARPDKQWRLIAYPYNAKSAKVGQKSGFMHLDLNLKRFRDEGLGKNTVQGSMSLMDENKDGCTLVVPGFHRHFEDWLKTKQALINSQPAHSTTTNMKSKEWYTPEDQARFGKPIPTPCPAGGIWLSQSIIIHGSTDRGTLLWQAMYPWFTTINEDHQTLENADCMSWEELARCHRDLVGPAKESLGNKPREGVDGARFPGAIPV